MNSGKCSLIIRGDKLNLADIGDNVKILPSRIVRKGDIISKTIGESQYDIWEYEIGFNENEMPQTALDTMLAQIIPFKSYLKNLKNGEDIYIKYYVQSEYAQIFLVISRDVLKKLADLDIRFEISILSWGGIDP